MKRNEFARNLAAGTYDLIVLDLLRDGPSYGYGIRKWIFAQSQCTLNWQEGTIDPVLRHLEEQGLVTSAWQGPKAGRQRCYASPRVVVSVRGVNAGSNGRPFTRAVDAVLASRS